MPKSGEIISLLGLRGAAGVTTTAINLAAILGAKGKKTALVDFHRPCRRDASILLNISAERSLDDLASLRHKTSPALLKGYATSADGFDFLPLSCTDRPAAPAQPGDVDVALRTLTSVYDYILLDTGPELGELTVQALDSSSLTILVLRNDFLSRGRLADFQRGLEELKFPLSLVHNVIQDDPEARKLPGSWQGLDKKEALATLPWDDKAWAESAGKARPLSLLFPRSSYARRAGELADRLIAMPAATSPTQPRHKKAVSPSGSRKEDGPDQVEDELKARLHKRLLSEIDAGRLELDLSGDKAKSARLRADVKRTVEKLIAEEGDGQVDRSARGRLIDEIINETLGLGPLEELLRDATITEIMANGPARIYVERNGKIELTGRRFVNENQLRTAIERIVAPLGRRIDESSPYVDARLPDGSRVNAIIPPLSLSGPVVTIRKFSVERLTIKDLIRLGTLSPEMADFLRACVEARINILISGGTGSGKTTFLNVVSAFIPPDERIITIEDSAELNLPQQHVITLESRPPNIEGTGQVTIRDLVRNSLRMRPDRIVIGECRGGEALDMLQAMNTGHDGSLTTGHANSARDMLLRLETMVLMSGIDLPSRAIREQISSAINLLVHTARLKDGSRKVVQIAEITGLSGDVISMQDIFTFKARSYKGEKVQGKMTATGIRPYFLDRFKPLGVELSDRVFK